MEEKGEIYRNSGVSSARRYTAGMQTGLPLWLYPAVHQENHGECNVPCIIRRNCDKIELFCPQTDRTEAKARMVQADACGWEHV